MAGAYAVMTACSQIGAIIGHQVGVMDEEPSYLSARLAVFTEVAGRGAGVPISWRSTLR